MRTEKEIKAKIEFLKDMMFKNCKAHYENKIPGRKEEKKFGELKKSAKYER